MKQKSQIASDVLSCFESFREKLPFDACVIDFAWLSKADAYKMCDGKNEERNVWVIEINPFVSIF